MSAAVWRVISLLWLAFFVVGMVGKHGWDEAAVVFIAWCLGFANGPERGPACTGTYRHRCKHE